MIHKTKSKLAIFFIVFLAIILGGLVGEILGSIPGLNFLKTGVQIGITEPITLNLMVIEVTLGLLFKINIMSIAGAWLGYILQRKIIEY